MTQAASTTRPPWPMLQTRRSMHRRCADGLQGHIAAWRTQAHLGRHWPQATLEREGHGNTLWRNRALGHLGHEGQQRCVLGHFGV
jgi:hypothetical protein